MTWLEKYQKEHNTTALPAEWLAEYNERIMRCVNDVYGEGTISAEICNSCKNCLRDCWGREI